ncbi:CocE/NonD family hydrolase [Streptomyces roseirectus]|uniref:CocE/NonD family hydrolase n=1 Tax=Streptomyces roseirectus TaxID=2768066 RepID=A0A7H0I7T7_9ACTN|nr:CocE/NonD family hydrolase [Streptomyces roseirectus]QNP68853.1 CocE/NonD family hydrolase [Streptomyces roseirectus]
MPARPLVVTMAAALALAQGALGASAAEQPPSPAGHLALSVLPAITSVEVEPGVRLRTEVYEPAGPGPHPLIVMPGPFLYPVEAYLLQAKRLAEAGYVVVAYQPRGYLGSGGTCGWAGPADVADASRLTSWALAHTTADPRRVGMAGVSYGAVVSLLAAAEDPRIKAVASLAGWVDKQDVLYGGDTRRLQTFLTQKTIIRAEARPDADLEQILAEYAENPDPSPHFEQWARTRSPLTRLDRLNAHHPAVFMAATWFDTAQTPNRIADFFDGYTGPKRLEIRPGDHATREIEGFTGLATLPWENTRRWFDRHLRHTTGDPDITTPLVLQPRNGLLSEPQDDEHYATWSAISARTLTPPLTPVTGQHPTVLTALDSGADAGFEFGGITDELVGLPPLAAAPLLPPGSAAVWSAPPADGVQRLRGIPRLHTTVTPGTSQGTFYAYLYDVGPTGLGRLITHAPHSFHDRAPHHPFPVDLDLSATAYDLPAGHRLQLVIDSRDPLYVSRNSLLGSLTFDSATTTLQVPVR